MNRRQMFIGITGLLLAVIGLMALWFPVYLDQYDAYGIKVTCGSGWRSNLTQALYATATTTLRPWSRVVTPHYSYVAPGRSRPLPWGGCWSPGFW